MMGECCNCGKDTTTKNKYGFECLICKCARLTALKRLTNKLRGNNE